MKIARISIAVILSLVMLYVAKTNSRGQSDFYIHTENGFTFEMNSVPKGIENDNVVIPITVKGDMKNLKLFFRKRKFGQTEETRLHKYGSTEMSLSNSANNVYTINQPTGDRGGKTFYYFEIRDNVGGIRAIFTDENKQPFVLKFIGDVPKPVLYGHIFFIFATVFCVMMATVHSFSVINNGSNLPSMAKFLFLASLFTFIGGYPLGFAMNWYAFNGLWEGVPFGTDATDNKTQLIFVYLIMTNLLTLGTLTKGKIKSDIYTAKIRGFYGLGSFFVMLAIYLIPHSIQFEPLFTKQVCYSFIGIVALIYLFGLITRKKHSYQIDPEKK